jgi:hypothetical protein
VSDTRTLVLGGYTYVLRHADALEALEVAARLGNASAPMFGGMATGKGAGRMANAVMYLLSSPELGPTARFVATTFAKYTQVCSPNGTSAGLDSCLNQHFAGRLKDFAAWLEAVVEFECGDFLGDMVQRLGEALAAAMREASPSESPKPAG